MMLPTAGCGSLCCLPPSYINRSRPTDRMLWVWKASRAVIPQNVMSSGRLGTKNHYAGERHQQFTHRCCRPPQPPYHHHHHQTDRQTDRHTFSICTAEARAQLQSLRTAEYGHEYLECPCWWGAVAIYQTRHIIYWTNWQTDIQAHDINPRVMKE